QRLRQGRVYRQIRRVLERYLGLPDFRVVHLSIQHNHLHLIVEAADRVVLTRRMQSFAINAARAINSAGGGRPRRGKVFAFRYHATQVRGPRQARCTLAYVLNNWRHHREDRSSLRASDATLDPYSSAMSFPPWKKLFRVPDGYVPLPVSPPTTALLHGQWRRFGAIDPTECPGGHHFA